MGTCRRITPLTMRPLRWGAWPEVGDPQVIFSKLKRRAVCARIGVVELRNSSMTS